MRTREWGTTDFYAVLGVDPAAPDTEIAAAFRSKAKELHPDARPGDPEAAEGFKRVSAAYDVLSEPTRRREYDRYRVTEPVRRAAPAAATGSFPAGTAPVTPVPANPPAPGASPRWNLTRKGARWAVVSGTLLIVLAFGAAALVILLGQRDAALRDRGVPTTATVVSVRGERELRFTTKTGRAVRTSEPDLKSGDRVPVGGTVKVVYDPEDPTRILTDEDTTARDITLWIVAGKFLICGTILAIVGALRLRRP